MLLSADDSNKPVQIIGMFQDQDSEDWQYVFKVEPGFRFGNFQVKSLKQQFGGEWLEGVGNITCYYFSQKQIDSSRGWLRPITNVQLIVKEIKEEIGL